MLNTGKKHRWGFPSASIHCHHVRIWPVMRSMNVRRTFLPSSAQFTDTDVGTELHFIFSAFSREYKLELDLLCLKTKRWLYPLEYESNKTTFQLLQNHILPINIVSVKIILSLFSFSISIVLMSASTCDWHQRTDWPSNCRPLCLANKQLFAKAATRPSLGHVCSV